MKKNILLSLSTLITFYVTQFASVATADDQTASLITEASVAGYCTFTSGDTMNFGVVNLAQVNNATPSSGTSITCNDTGTVYVGGDAGLHPAGTGSGTRAMIGYAHSELIGYDLYADSGYVNVLDVANLTNSTNGTNISVSVTNATPAFVTIYGKIPDQNGVSPDDYSDTVTINYCYDGFCNKFF